MDAISETQLESHEPQLSRKRKKLIKKREKRRIEIINSRNDSAISVDIGDMKPEISVTEKQKSIMRNYKKPALENATVHSNISNTIKVKAPFEFKKIKLPPLESSQKRNGDIEQLVESYFINPTRKSHENLKSVNSEISMDKEAQLQNKYYPHFVRATNDTDSNEPKNLIQLRKRKLDVGNLDDDAPPAKRARLIDLDSHFNVQKPITNPKRKLADDTGVKEITQFIAKEANLVSETNIDIMKTPNIKLSAVDNKVCDKYEIETDLKLVKNNVEKKQHNVL